MKKYKRLNVKSERLRGIAEREMRDLRASAASRLRALRAFGKYDRIYGAVIEAYRENWVWSSGDKIYLATEHKDKPSFSAAVKEIAVMLGQPPEKVKVEPGSYVAEWEIEGTVLHIYCTSVTDCKVIETEETKVVKILKPHPECIAAMKELEDL